MSFRQFFLREGIQSGVIDALSRRMGFEEYGDFVLTLTSFHTYVGRLRGTMKHTLTLSVRRRDGIPEYDKYMLDVQKGNAKLAVTQDIISHAGALGRSVSFAQLIATWANTCSERHLLTKLPANAQTQIKHFVSRLHGLVAAYYADRVTACDGETDLKQALLEAAAPRIKAMGKRQFAKTAKGELTELVFVHRARYQFHSAVYRNGPSSSEIMDPQRHGELIVSPHEMNALMLEVLKSQNFFNSDLDRIKPLLNERSCHLGTLLHETFRNTAEHAYLDMDGRIPSKGLRCILIARRNINPDSLEQTVLISAKHPKLSPYFQQLRDRANLGKRRQVHILELSVLDTGPGLAETIRFRMDARMNDLDLVTKCFQDRVSSKRGLNSGLGLGRILYHIDKLGGFIRIRTSTTEAFFSSHSHTPSDNQLVPHVVGELPKAIGTALTIAIPLEL